MKTKIGKIGSGYQIFVESPTAKSGFIKQGVRFRSKKEAIREAGRFQ